MGESKWSKYAEIKINLDESDEIKYKVEVENEKSRKIINKSAIYWVCLDVGINRIAGRDADGTLVIGKTKNLETRFKKFISGVEKSTGHSEGNLLHHLYWKSKSFSNKFIKKKIVFYYSLTKEKDLDKKERDNIIWYIKKYGEPPVLNSSIPDRYNNW